MRDRIGTNDLANGAVRYGVYDACLLYTSDAADE